MKLLLLSVLVLYSNTLISQNIFEVYREDLHLYFKPIGTKVGDFTRFYYDIDNLKDTIQNKIKDGVYIFYSVYKKDSLLKNNENLHKGQYINSMKEGEFISLKYQYNKKMKSNNIVNKHICFYKNGVKNGIEKEEHFNYNLYDNKKVVFTENFVDFYGEYVNGIKHGIFLIDSHNGYDFKIEIYQNGVLKQEMIKNEP